MNLFLRVTSLLLMASGAGYASDLEINGDAIANPHKTPTASKCHPRIIPHGLPRSPSKLDLMTPAVTVLHYISPSISDLLAKKTKDEVRYPVTQTNPIKASDYHGALNLSAQLPSQKATLPESFHKSSPTRVLISDSKNNISQNIPAQQHAPADPIFQKIASQPPRLRRSDSDSTTSHSECEYGNLMITNYHPTWLR
ncbi:MAG: hypothetical protein NTX76_06310 [Alphaproteobacteria bacterium]|nr:hypothetical protein [Alphaproteobacteria bacterium]